MAEFKDKAHRDKIIDRIRKILALANGTSYEGEASTAMRMAKDLMASYGLDMTEIELKESIKSSVTKQATKRCGRLSTWERYVAQTIEILCDTKMIVNYISRTQAHFLFIGMKQDVELSLELFDSFTLTMKHLAIKEYPDLFRRKSFLIGMSRCLVDRAEKITAETKETTKTYGALVVYKEQEIDDYMKENFKNLKSRPTKFTYNPDAYFKGYDAGKQMDLGVGKKIE